MAGFFDFFRRRTSRPTGDGEAAAVREVAFREIKNIWSADDSDITEVENGFDWLPASHAVHVRIMPEEDGDDPSRHRLWVATEFLRSVGSDERTAGDIGTLTPVICPTFAPVRWTKGGSGSGPTNLQFFSSVYVNDDTVRTFAGLLARMSLLQPLVAEHAADDFSRFLRGTPALATGSKRQTDSIVSHIGGMLSGKSDGISDWNGSPEFSSFVERYARNDNCFGIADQGTGMTLETPFGSDTVLIRFETDGAFPGLGNGLLVRTMLRSTDTSEKICSLASLLNELEGKQWTDFAQLGSWHLNSQSDDKSVLVHSCFIPNLFFADGLVTNYGLWAIARALWARDILLPDVTSKTMAEILEARLGKAD